MGALARLVQRARHVLRGSASFAGAADLRGGADKKAKPLSQRLVEGTKRLWRGRSPASVVPTATDAAERSAPLELDCTPLKKRRRLTPPRKPHHIFGLVDRAKVLWRGPGPASANYFTSERVVERTEAMGHASGVTIVRRPKIRPRTTAENVKHLVKTVDAMDRRQKKAEQKKKWTRRIPRWILEATIPAFACSYAELKEYLQWLKRYFQNDGAVDSTSEQISDVVLPW